MSGRPTFAACARAARFAREERAASMVEFAIVAPVLFVCLFAVVDCGRALFLYNNLQDAARRGARFGAVQLPKPCGDAEAGRVKDSVASWVQEFNANQLAADSIRKFVQVRCDTSTTLATNVATNVNVTIAGYPFRPLTPLPKLGIAAFDSLAITKSAQARSEGAPDGY